MIWLAAVAAWGFAEATLFFIVPDVLITYAALKFGLRKALHLSVAAAGAAVLGGIVLWLWGAQDPQSARHAMLMVPAIDSDLLERVRRETADFWPLHLFTGAITGVPYKLYAVEAGARGIDLTAFAALSFAARFARFGLAAGLTALAREGLVRLDRTRWCVAVWAAGWFLLYTVYFSLRALA
jgi:membrane protein YqaA with SNARE-associated domain